MLSAREGAGRLPLDVPALSGWRCTHSPTGGRAEGQARSYFLPVGESFRDAELMQYRKPVGAGPSGNTCPR